MTHVLIVGGLTLDAHDRVRRESANRLAPGGHLVMRPIKGGLGYAPDAAAALLLGAREILRSLPEDVPASLQLAYVDYGDESTLRFRRSFFPFCLTHPVSPVDVASGASRRLVNEGLNALTRNVIAAATTLRATASRVAEQTNLPNLTPLLLPVRNFTGPGLEDMLERLFDLLGRSPKPGEFLNAEVARFLAHHPRLRPPGSSRHCLSDGQHHFKSPGKDRHGFYRNVTDGSHGPTCLLNARSRLGGAYDYRFHFDCEACGGRLAKTYPNCHDEVVPPKSTHVNIAPNDGII